MSFNYRDWWGWVFWSVFIIIGISIVSNIHTLERWKWGYWSIDLIPATVMLFVLFVCNTTILLVRMNKRIYDLEEEAK